MSRRRLLLRSRPLQTHASQLKTPKKIKKVGAIPASRIYLKRDKSDTQSEFPAFMWMRNLLKMPVFHANLWLTRKH